MHGGANRYLKSLAREPARRSIHLSSLLACLASSAVRPKSSIIENPAILYQIHIQRTLGVPELLSGSAPRSSCATDPPRRDPDALEPAQGDSGVKRQ